MEESHRSSESGDGRTTPTTTATDDDYQITADQRQAMLELETQKAETVYPDEEPPEYDVTDRLKQLNAELKEEAEPSSDRPYRVGFPENPVSMVVPPPSFSDDDESNKDKDSARDTEETADADKNVVAEADRNVASDESTKLAESNDNETDNTVEEEKKENREETTDNNADSTGDSEQRHLVEKDGKFEYISHDEYTALESTTSERQRPHSVSGTESRRHEDSRTRAQSASTSKYGLSPEQRKDAEDRDRKERERTRREEERRRREEEERKKDNDDAFQAWLKRKREQQKEEARREKERNQTTEEEDRDAGKAYKEWCQLKSKRQQEEREMEERRHMEELNGYFVRSRKECDKAFRAWLKKKKVPTATLR